MSHMNNLDPSRVLKNIVSLPTLFSFLIVSGVIALIATGFDIDIKQVFSSISEVNFLLFALGFFTHYISFIFRGVRWKILIGDIHCQELKPRTFEYVKLIFLSNFINSVSLFRVGDLYKVYAFNKKYSHGFTVLLGTLITERFFDCIMLAVFTGVFGQLLLKTSHPEIQFLIYVPVILLIILSLAIVIVNKLSIPSLIWLHSPLKKIKKGTNIPKSAVMPALIMSLLAWTCEIVRVYLIASALHLDLKFTHTAILSLTHAMLTLVPTPGGIGAVESGVATVGTLLIGMTAEQSISLILLDRSITYLSVIFIGAILFTIVIVNLRKTK